MTEPENPMSGCALVALLANCYVDTGLSTLIVQINFLHKFKLLHYNNYNHNVFLSEGILEFYPVRYC